MYLSPVRIVFALLVQAALVVGPAYAGKPVEFVVEITMTPQMALGPREEAGTALIFVEARSPVSMVVEAPADVTATLVELKDDRAVREGAGRKPAQAFHATYQVMVRATGKRDFLGEIELIVRDERGDERRRMAIAVAGEKGVLYLTRERALTLRQFIDAIEKGRSKKP